MALQTSGFLSQWTRDALKGLRIPHVRYCLEANTGRSPWKCECIAKAHNAKVDELLGLG
jgi:hypothetical protein